MEEDKSVIDKLTDDINELLDNTDDIDDLLILWNENNRGIKKFQESIERIKTKIKTFLKEKQWDRYDNKDMKMSVVITKQKRESFDKEQLKLILTDSQYAMVLKTVTFEKMQIITPDTRAKMKKFVK